MLLIVLYIVVAIVGGTKGMRPVFWKLWGAAFLMELVGQVIYFLIKGSEDYTLGLALFLLLTFRIVPITMLILGWRKGRVTVPPPTVPTSGV